MRITLNLEDDVVRMVRSYAESRSLRLGRAVCELLRMGCRPPMRTRIVNGIHVVDLPLGSPPITTRRVKEMGELE